MKKVLGLALALLFAGVLNGCNPTYVPQPYQIKLGNLGYEVDDKGKITVPAVNVEIFSAAGAPDISDVRYKAQFRTLDNVEFAPNDSNIEGLLFLSAKGGYICTTTDDRLCGWSSPDVYPANRSTNDSAGLGSIKLANVALIAGIWAVNHSKNGFPAGVKVAFTFTGRTSKGDVVSWTSDEQFVTPAKPGGL